MSAKILALRRVRSQARRKQQLKMRQHQQELIINTYLTLKRQGRLPANFQVPPCPWETM